MKPYLNKGSFILFGFMVIINFSINAQVKNIQFNSDSSLKELNNYRNEYFSKEFQSKTKNISGILNGREYLPYTNFLKEGSVYFNSEEWAKGNLIYNHIQYFNIPLKYDLKQDILISPCVKYESIVQLNTNQITEFELFGHKFINLEEKPDSNINTGFYDLIYSGKSKIIVKRSILIEEKIILNQEEFNSKLINTFYIYHDNEYWKFKSQSDLLKIFKNQKKVLMDFIHNEKIIYKKNPELNMVRIVNKADHL